MISLDNKLFTKFKCIYEECKAKCCYKPALSDEEVKRIINIAKILFGKVPDGLIIEFDGKQRIGNENKCLFLTPDYKCLIELVFGWEFKPENCKAYPVYKNGSRIYVHPLANCPGIDRSDGEVLLLQVLPVIKHWIGEIVVNEIVKKVGGENEH